MNRTWRVRLRRSLRIWRGVHAKAVWNTGSRLRGADCEERDGRPGIDQEPRHQVGQRARRWLQGGPLRPLWDGAQGGTDIGFLLKLFKGVSYSLFHRASPVSSIFSGLEIPWQIAAIGSWDPLLISHVFCLNFFECWIELHVIAFGCMWLHLIVDCRLICICRLHCVFFSFFLSWRSRGKLLPLVPGFFPLFVSVRLCCPLQVHEFSGLLETIQEAQAACFTAPTALHRHKNGRVCVCFTHLR